MKPPTALIIIDMQRAYFEADTLKAQEANIVDEINLLLQTAADQDLPVFAIMTVHKKDQSTWTLNMLEDQQGFVFEDEDHTQLVDGLQVSSVVSITKTRDSAFYDTDFAQQLRQRGIARLIICGVSTHSCILMTAADAYARNLEVILAKDAIASHDPAMHDVTLSMLEKEYRQPLLTTEEICHQLNQEAGLSAETQTGTIH